MNKRSQNNISTSRILKSKYLDKSKDKQQTLPLRNQHQQQSPIPNKRRIKLVDLCPEEKLKVGELIKTLEERRTINEELLAELQHVRGEKQTLQTELQKIEGQLQRTNELFREQQGKICALNEQIFHLKESLKQQARKNVQLARTSQKYLLKLHQFQKDKHSVAVQVTSPASTAHQETQVIIPPSRETAIQTDKSDRERDRDLFYRPHSKSFEKIMKAPSVELPKSIKDSRSFQSSRQKSRSPHVYQRLSPQNDPMTEKITPNQQQEEEELQELDEKWAKLKVKHRQGGKVNWQGSPHSFHISEETEKSSKRKGKGKGPLGMQGMDEEALNRMLRLKDFSASKLIRLGQGHSQSHERGLSSAKPQEHLSPEVNYLKSPYFNRVESDSNQNTRALKGVKITPTPEEINFYESGLFDGNSA